MSISKIISGGQTGADRAALDAALACGIPHGGFCPAGRRAEDGVIPAIYDLEELESPNYPDRTRANVLAADVTLIFSHGPLTGGSLLTQEFAAELGKPCIHVDLLKPRSVFQSLDETVPARGALTVNIAGPRASGDPAIYDAVYTCLCAALSAPS